MRHYLIMSHGKLALGIKNTLEMFVGAKDNIHYISAYVDDTKLSDVVRPFISSLDKEDELIILTDLLGGSVNSEMMKYIKRPHTHLIAGFNYSLILELVLQTSDYMTREEIQTSIEKARMQMTYVNSIEAKVDEGDEY